jgi:hypothetical protein
MRNKHSKMMTVKSATSHTATDKFVLALLHTTKKSAKIEKSVRLKAFTFSNSFSAHDKLLAIFIKRSLEICFMKCVLKYGKK